MRKFVEELVAEHGGKIKSKDLGKEVAESYAKKIGKAIVPALEKAVKSSKKVSVVDGTFKGK